MHSISRAMAIYVFSFLILVITFGNSIAFDTHVQSASVIESHISSDGTQYWVLTYRWGDRLNGDRLINEMYKEKFVGIMSDIETQFYNDGGYLSFVEIVAYQTSPLGSALIRYGPEEEGIMGQVNAFSTYYLNATFSGYSFI